MFYIAVDFDGTCVYNEFPSIGYSLPNCIKVLRELNRKGYKLVLNTLRDGKELKEAVEWFAERDIELYGINENKDLPEGLNKKKVYANMYIDDCGLGIPLIDDEEKHSLPFVDWFKVEELLREKEMVS